MISTNATPKAWIGCLAAYNAGRLHGEWVDATDSDEMYEAAKEVIRTSPAWQLDGHAEEWFIADYDEFGELTSTLGEYSSFETVAKVGALIEEHGAPFIAWASTQDDVTELSGERFQESYRGDYDSEKDYAMEQVCELGWGEVEGEVWDKLASYIDWDTVVTEMFQHGGYSYVDGHVFEETYS